MSADQQLPQIIIKIDGDHLKLIDKELQRLNELVRSEDKELRAFALKQLESFHKDLQLMNQVNQVKSDPKVS